MACWHWRDIAPLAERLSLSRPDCQESAENSFDAMSPLLVLKDLSAGYMTCPSPLNLRRVPKPIVEHISLEIRPGESLALVGESGSGKTTVARAVNGLLPYVKGTIEFAGDCDLKATVSQRSPEALRCVQLVFQNPDASLNPRQKVAQIVGRPLEMFFHLSGGALRRRVEELLADVRLDCKYCDCFPDELSGGERQRVAIAPLWQRNPSCCSATRSFSALDVSVQANILELLIDLQNQKGIAFLFISHDLAVVRSLAHRVGVLYWGLLCEFGKVEEVYCPPYHPYTYLLLSAVPEADPDQVTTPARRDAGLRTEAHRAACPFAPRCPVKVGEICEKVAPPWIQISPTHCLRCHAPIEILNQHNLWTDRFARSANAEP